jgi:hypothetical protein
MLRFYNSMQFDKTGNLKNLDELWGRNLGQNDLALVLRAQSRKLYNVDVVVGKMLLKP